MKAVSLVGLSLAALALAAAGEQVLEIVTSPPPDAASVVVPEMADGLGPIETVAALGPHRVAAAQAEVQSAFQYKGTAVSVAAGVPAGNVYVQRACAMLEENDFVPDLRVKRFSAIPPDFSLVGWKLTVVGVDVREDETFVRVRSGPILKKLGEGTIGVLTTYQELYRIADGGLQFLEGEPMPRDMTVSMAGM